MIRRMSNDPPSRTDSEAPSVDAAAGPTLPPARLMSPVRDRVELREYCLDSLVPESHPVRWIWQFVLSTDLEALRLPIKARQGHPGRPAIDPAILFALWLWATIDAVATARRIDRLCKRDDTYRWICGGVGVNYHAIADFRTRNAAWLDAQLTRSVAALISAGVVDLDRVAQDGMRVRAHAKAASFHRVGSLEEALERATDQVRALAAERATGGGDPGLSRREQAARARAARERQERLERALVTMSELQSSTATASSPPDGPPSDPNDPPSGGGGGGGAAATPGAESVGANKPAKAAKAAKKTPPAPRVSSTDPQARVMKMADGGFRPAYNLQFAVDVDTRLIVGLDLVNAGSDMAQWLPMHEQLVARYARSATTYLVDGGYTTLAAIQRLSEDGVCVLAPRPKPRTVGLDPGARKKGDTDQIAAWRARMGTDEAKALYTQRAASVECNNAWARTQGLTRFEVVGVARARAVGLIHALAQHAMRLASLGICRLPATAEATATS